MLFPAHLQARELCPQTYSLSLPLEWSQVTHIPASIKSGGAYKPEKSALPLPDNCVMTPVFQEGSLPFHHTHKYSSPFRQALHTQIANHHIQQARKSFYCVFWGFFFLEDFFKVPPSQMKVPPDHYKGPQATSKGHAPLVDSSCRHGKV